MQSLTSIPAPSTPSRLPLPDWLSDLVTRPPRAGEGVHAWLFRVARQLHAHLPAGEIVGLLESQTANCGRRVPHNEIVSAVQNALACAWQPTGRDTVTQVVSRWPTVNKERREAIVRNGGGLADLWETSPIRLQDNDQHTEELVDRLFPGNPLLCCGKSNREFDTRPREDWRGQLAELALVVPSPMTTRTGLTREGKESTHALGNTGPRRFLVIEFDTGTADEHAALLLYLATLAPLVLAVHSGNKSLHGWFYCAGQPEDKLLRFMRYAASLGADSRLWSRCQFCRMPDGTRENGKRQTVFYFNPQPLEVQP
jgi:hypothetical protein